MNEEEKFIEKKKERKIFGNGNPVARKMIQLLGQMLTKLFPQQPCLFLQNQLPNWEKN
jgi:hypothetical protein